MREITQIQDQYCSSYDKRKFYSYDVEFIDEDTKPLIHRQARFLYLLKGKATISIDGMNYEIKKGSMVAILPWETTVIKDVESPLHFIKVVYNSSIIQNMLKLQLNMISSDYSIINPIIENPVIQLTKAEQTKMESILESIKQEVGIDSIYDVEQEKELSEIYVSNKIIEIIIDFIRYIEKKKTCVTKSGEEIELDNRQNIFKYIYSHISNRLTLDCLSDVFYMSESTISRYITDVTGRTFNDLVNDMRITKAIDLLTYTDLALIDIAYMVGYTDASHLVKVFTARMNLSPKQYRSIYKAKDHMFKDQNRSLTFEIIDYILKNYHEDLSAAGVAKRFDISVIELNRKLLFQLEVNFEDFLQHLRINRACELLLTTDLPVVHIALDVGYNTIKTFDRNFLKLKGMTPTVFRKNIRLDDEEPEVLPNDIY